MYKENWGLRYWILHRLPVRWLSSKLTRNQFMMVSGILVGMSAGLAAVLLKTVVHYLNFIITYDYPISDELKKYLLLFFPLIGLLITVTIVKFIFKGDDGKGIAGVLYEIAKKSSIVKRSKMYSQLLTSSVTVGFGGSSGLEGPIAVTGSAIGSTFGKVYHLNYRDRTLLLAAGAAGGISGVFNAPITGVMFAVEVILSGVSIIEFIPLILASVSGTIFSQVILNENILFFFKQKQVFDFRNIPFYILLGLLCGFVSLYYSYLVLKIEKFFSSFNKGVYLKALTGGIILAILIFVFPSLFGEGYFAVSSLADDQPENTFKGSILESMIKQEWVLLLLIGVISLVKAIATSTTIHSGGNGGNFAPSLFVGAHVGYLFAKLFNSLGLNFLKLPISNFTLVGMSGILSGVLYAPITAIFLIAEVTGGYDLIIPLMIVSAVAFLVVKQIEPHSMETRRLAKKGDLLTSNKDDNLLTMIKMEPYIEKDIITIQPENSLRELIECVKKSKRNIFAVVDKNNFFLGIVLLDDIKEFMFDQDQYDVLKVFSIMKDPPAIIERNEDMKSVMKKFDETGSWNLPITSDGKYLGFISKSTILGSYRNELIRQS